MRITIVIDGQRTLLNIPADEENNFSRFINNLNHVEHIEFWLDEGRTRVRMRSREEVTDNGNRLFRLSTTQSQKNKLNANVYGHATQFIPRQSTADRLDGETINIQPTFNLGILINIERL